MMKKIVMLLCGFLIAVNVYASDLDYWHNTQKVVGRNAVILLEHFLVNISYIELTGTVLSVSDSSIVVRVKTVNGSLYEENLIVNVFFMAQYAVINDTVPEHFALHSYPLRKEGIIAIAEQPTFLRRIARWLTFNFSNDIYVRSDILKRVRESKDKGE